METLEDFLAHYGVRGMKWGVRKKNRLPASSDAAKAQEFGKIAKKHGTQALSNKELQDLVTRMNLEKQYSSLGAKSKRKNAGMKFVSDVIGGIAKQQAMKIGNDYASKQVASLLENAKAGYTGK